MAEFFITAGLVIWLSYDIDWVPGVDGVCGRCHSKWSIPSVLLLMVCEHVCVIWSLFFKTPLLWFFILTLRLDLHFFLVADM
jgi:hypothetical protein